IVAFVWLSLTAPCLACPPGTYVVNGIAGPVCIPIPGGSSGSLNPAPGTGGSADELDLAAPLGVRPKPPPSAAMPDLYGQLTIPPHAARAWEGYSDLYAVRAYMKNVDILNNGYAAYGVVVLRSLPTPNTMLRLRMFCEAYKAALPRTGT